MPITVGYEPTSAIAALATQSGLNDAAWQNVSIQNQATQQRKAAAAALAAQQAAFAQANANREDQQAFDLQKLSLADTYSQQAAKRGQEFDLQRDESRAKLQMAETETRLKLESTLKELEKTYDYTQGQARRKAEISQKLTEAETMRDNGELTDADFNRAQGELYAQKLGIRPTELKDRMPTIQEDFAANSFVNDAGQVITRDRNGEFKITNPTKASEISQAERNELWKLAITRATTKNGAVESIDQAQAELFFRQMLEESLPPPRSDSGAKGQDPYIASPPAGSVKAEPPPIPPAEKLKALSPQERDLLDRIMKNGTPEQKAKALQLINAQGEPR